VIPSIFAGLAWAELTALIPGLGMPVVIDKVLQALALAAPPCGLIMAGAMSSISIRCGSPWPP
jgi:malonate transporter